MDTREARIRSYLTDDGLEQMLDIILRRTLGAAPHINAIGCIYIDALQKGCKEGITADEGIAMIRDITEYFIDVRGNICCAVATAMSIITKGIEDYSGKTALELLEYISGQVSRYHALNKSWAEQIKVYGYEVIKDFNSMLLYDYSSSVNAMMEVAAEHGKKMTVYIPESRSLNGGYHYAVTAARLKHDAIFLPDNAILYGVEKADVSFIGAESIYPDGSTSNTVGSDLVALLCSHFNKPYYVISSLIKFDIRGLNGYKQPPHWKYLRERLGGDWTPEIKDNISFTCPNLSQVPPALIKGYITEQGVLPPSAMFSVGKSFIESI